MRTQKAGMEPARSIIKKLGGEAVVAEVTKRRITSPYRWQAPEDRGGTGGRIPGQHVPALLAHAKSINVPLTLAEFFPGVEADVSSASADLQTEAARA